MSSYPYDRTSDPVGGAPRMSPTDMDQTFSTAGQGMGAEIIDAARMLPLSDGRLLNTDILAGGIHHETGGGTSKIFLDKNNPGGIGAENDDPYGKAISFETRRDGVIAYVAGKITYNDIHPSEQARQLDPRFAIRAKAGYIGIVQREDKALYEYEQRYAWTAPDVYAATPLTKRYGAMVASRTNYMVETAGSRESVSEIPGFEWAPADNDHYTVGRKENGAPARIRGGAQHYTAGSNSLAWLRSTSEPEVSIHFLVKHAPTMDDRGWQLVKLRDTCWATAFANPYTVGIEYEHIAGQRIPDIAYEVLAATWEDITHTVREQGLGDIERIQGHKVWVNNPSLVCPDGIDVARIAQRWTELMTGASSLDPNRLLCPTKNELGQPFEIVNTSIDGRWIAMLEAWYALGGAAHNVDDSVRRVGWPQTGMYFEPGDGSYRQIFDNAMVELHRDDSFRIGGLGMAYVAALKRIRELEGSSA